MKKKSIKVFKILSVVAFLLSLAVFVYFIVLPLLPVEVLLPVLSETSTLGYERVVPNAYAEEGIGVIILSSKCYVVEGNTEEWIANSIVNGLANRTEFRPDAHDILRDLLKSLDIEVLMVKVVDMVNNTFIGRLVLKQGNKVVSLDVRPSNGIAIAVRVGAPIYMREDLLKEYGKYVC
jgi:hypothetical protein